VCSAEDIVNRMVAARRHNADRGHRQSSDIVFACRQHIAHEGHDAPEARGGTTRRVRAAMR